jgi:putative aldouronate transport system substrate-binding protein
MAALLAVLLPAGCSTGRSSDPPGEPGDTGAKDDMSVHHEIRIGMWDSARWGKNDEIGRYIEEKLNITIVPITLSTVDYIEKLSISAAGGTLPDMFMHPGYSGYSNMLVKWVNEDVVKALPGDLSDYPHLDKLMKDYEFFKQDGRHYYIPRTVFTDPENAYYTPALWVRSDWMRNVGVTEMPTTLDGLYSLLEKFTYNDPDGNGRDDTYGVTPGLGLDWVFFAHGIDISGYILEDGLWIPGMLSKYNAEPIKFIKKMYDNGILDRDFATMRLADSENNFCAGRCGVIYLVGESSPMQYVSLAKLASVNRDFNAQTDLGILPPPSAEGRDYLSTQNYNFAQGTMFNSRISDAKLARCLTLYDYLLSDEGITLGRFGVEGISFKMEDGAIVPTLPKDSAGNDRWIGDIYPTVTITRTARWDVDGAWVSPDIRPEFVTLAQRVRDLYGPKMNAKNPGIDFMSTPAKDRWNITEFFWERVYQMVLNSNDIDASWEDLRTTLLNDRNGQKLINEINE